MHYSIIKTVLEAQHATDPMVLDYHEAAKKWTLTFPPHAATDNLSFAFLGGGSNKLVFHVLQSDKPTEWVVCLQSKPGANNAKKSITDEMGILQRLATLQVLVPQPFSATAKQNDLLLTFQVNNLDSNVDPGPVYGFFEEYFDLQSVGQPNGRYVEMRKAGGDLPHWLKRTLSNQKLDSERLSRTIQCLNSIKAAWVAQKWGDFQVLYDTQTGDLICFDPYTDTSNAWATDKILAQWELDLDEIVKAKK